MQSGPSAIVAPVDHDRLRAGVLGAAAGAMIAVPTVGPLAFGTREGAEPFDTPITPPDYAFAIWGPIFAGVAANAVAHLREPSAEDHRATGWWLAGAYAANALWLVVAQSGRFRGTAAILPVAAGCAWQVHRRLQDVAPRAGGTGVGASSTGLLVGWTGLASVINLLAVSPSGRTGSVRSGPLARGAVLTASLAIAAIVDGSRRGREAVAVASCWGLLTGALDRRRDRSTRLAGAVGAAAVVAAAVRRPRQEADVDRRRPTVATRLGVSSASPGHRCGP